MSRLVLIDRPERDWQMQPGDVAVLNSGGPPMVVEMVKPDGQRFCTWDGGEGLFHSVTIRPPFEMRILMEPVEQAPYQG